MPTRAPDPSSPREVAGSITSAVVRHVRNVAGDDRVAELLRDARWSGDDPERLGGWCSATAAGRLLEAASRICGDLDIGERVGEEMIAYGIAHGARAMFKSVRSPADILRSVTTSGGKLATTTITEAVELAPDYAVVRAYDRTSDHREAWSCGISRGLLRSLPRYLGMEPATLTESECQSRGGRHCLYRLSWMPRPDRGQTDDQGAEGAEGENPDIAAVTRRLEALQATATELTAAQDVDEVLALITERAGVAVQAPQFLLAVRTGDDALPQVHQLGCTGETAAEMAHALLEGNLDEGDGARLIVDIASARRHYGKLVAIFPATHSFFEYERRLLAAYAGHAAAALDAATSLDAARRDRDTARALLDLAGALARVGTRAEVAERLAAAIPAVAACDRANVWLWDPEESSLELMGRAAAPPAGPDLPTRLQAEDVPNLMQLAANPRPLIVTAQSASGSIRRFMDATGTAASAIVPICAHGQFLGVAAAGFTDPGAPERIPDLFDRLAGLADHGATALANAELLERIRHQALHDTLTGLANRPLLEDRLDVALRHANRKGGQVSLMFLDLDRFKNVNDTLGHSSGDELLRLVSKRLAATVRDSDTLARLGGDEFVVLLGQDAGPCAAEAVAEKLLKVLRQPFFVAEHELYISGSMGVVHAPEHGTDCGTLLAHADAAMYTAKDLGRNTFQTYRSTPADSRREELKLESRLHTAVERGELVTLYQPQVDLRTMRVTGVEALVRWDHPELGRLGPDRFIPLAEETGVIVDIDRWVLDQACRQARAWLDSGLPPLRIAVNLSTRDVRDPALRSVVAAALATYDLPAELLELEVTDRVVLEDDDDLVAILKGLKTLGVRLAIDDFGTGSSVLRRIERCPIDTLKIDKSFVQEITSMTSEAPVVLALISMAERLGMELVAEGVESAVQGGFLRRRGCHLAQGFFFAQPLPPEEVERLVMLTTRPVESLPA